MSETDMSRNPPAEKGVDAVGSVEKLVDDDEIFRFDFFFERSYGIDGDQLFDTEVLEPVNIGPCVDFRGKKPVAAAMAAEKSDPCPLQRSQNEGIRGASEGSVEADFRDIFNPFDFIKARAAEDADFRPSLHLCAFWGQSIS